MALSTQPYKGTRDFYPEDKRLQKYIFQTMRKVAERYGYEEYDAPLLEPLELYMAKTGEEIVNEQTYLFTDRGERQVVIRPEMTPSVSRMVAARRQELGYPLRWYSIPNLWRYERPQRGRLREHWQLNVDLFGVEGLEAEQEIIMLANDIMKKFGAKPDMYTIKLNSRKLMNYFMDEVLGLDDTQANTISRLIDRMHKMEYAEFVAQTDAVFSPSQRENNGPDQLFEFLKTYSLATLPETLKDQPAVTELRGLLGMLETAGVSNAVFDPSLMRGFDYYTDIVFEIYDTHPDNNRSMFGGGRYDGLVGLFGVEPVPTIGFGMGDVALQNFLEVHGLLPTLPSETDVYVVLIGDVQNKSQKAISYLRSNGLNVAVDFSGRKPDKQIKTADKKGIAYVLFIGEDELTEERFNLKHLKTGETETHGLDRIISIVKDYRKK